METPLPNDPQTGSRPLLFSIVALVLAGGVLGIEYAVSPAPAQPASVAIATDAFADVSLIAKAAVVIDIQTGQTLFEKNASVQLPLASLTKVALVLAVAEVLQPDDLITIERAIPPAGSGGGIRRGERWRIGDLIDYTLIASSNEGAEVLAAAADDALRARYPDAPEGGAAVWRMNRLAGELGLTQTFFLNVSGLDESPSQSGAYGTAHDVARLFAYAASAAHDLLAGTAESGLLLTSASGVSSASAENTNESQGSIHGLIMGKTGYTDLAGGNLAVVFDVGLSRPVVAVVLGSTREGRFADMQKLVSASRRAISSQ